VSRVSVPDDVHVDTVLGTVVGAALIIGLTAAVVIAVIAGQRSLDRPGVRAPTPESGDDPLRLEFHPDGTPRAVRIRGPHCRY
jgi:hypothetical protein